MRASLWAVCSFIPAHYIHSERGSLVLSSPPPPLQVGHPLVWWGSPWDTEPLLLPTLWLLSSGELRRRINISPSLSAQSQLPVWLAPPWEWARWSWFSWSVIHRVTPPRIHWNPVLWPLTAKKSERVGLSFFFQGTAQRRMLRGLHILLVGLLHQNTPPFRNLQTVAGTCLSHSPPPPYHRIPTLQAHVQALLRTRSSSPEVGLWFCWR